MVLRSMEHDDLMREMPLIEKLSTQERLKLARRRRKEQLRRFMAREKESTSRRGREAESRSRRLRQTRCGVTFVDSVMLLEAAARSDVDEVRRLLCLGVDPNSTNEDGLTALHQCCIDDSEAMMTLLLDYGANVDAEDSERWTPLHAAATCGHLHLVTTLVERGANLLAVNADGNMAYDICEDDATLEYIETQMASRGVTQQLIEQTRGQIEAAMLEDLKQRPTSALEERVAQQATPLHIAAANGYMSVVEYLLDNHVTVHARDKDDWQPVHAAACWGHAPVIEVLYQNGADLSALTRNGETPFDVCEDPEIRDRLEQLRSEQELKKTEVARPRVRRTQSTKHSIRRTSMREKTLTPKKDVKQEARIRLGAEETRSPLAESGRRMDPPSPSDSAQLSEVSGLTSPAREERVTVSPASSDSRSEVAAVDDVIDGPSPCDSRSEAPLTVLGESNGTSAALNGGHTTEDRIPRESAKTAVGSSSSATSLESGKIDIHVHVTVNTGGAAGGGGAAAASDGAPPAYSATYSPPSSSYTASYSHPGTLADLKKQRSLSRAALAALTLRPLPVDELSQRQQQPTPSQQLSPQLPAVQLSPQLPRRRFVTGEGGLVTSEPPRERAGCCWLQ